MTQADQIDLRRDEDALRLRTRPRRVKAEFPEQGGTVRTLEGMVSYSAGDVLLTGEAVGDRWPVERENFELWYRPLVPSCMGEPGIYIKRARLCWGKMLKTDFDMKLPGERGVLHGKAGDWLVQTDSGQVSIVAPDVFADSYELVSDGRNLKVTFLRWRWIAGGAVPIAILFVAAFLFTTFLKKGLGGQWNCLSLASWVSWKKLASAGLVAGVKTFQAFSGNLSPEAESWPINLCILAIPILISTTAVLAFWDQLADWSSKVHHWMYSADDVVFGGGWVHSGLLPLISRGGEGGRRPFLVDRDKACRASTIRSANGVRFGKSDLKDAFEPLFLQPLRAQRIWVATGDDQQNIELARRLLEEFKPTHHLPKILVHIDDHRVIRVGGDLLAQIKRDRRLAVDIDFFDINRLAARAIFRLRPPSLRHAPSGCIHLLLVGASDLTLAMMAQAARHFVWSESPEECVRVTVVGTGTNDLLEKCDAMYPALRSLGGDGRAPSALFPLIRLQVHERHECTVSPREWRDWQVDESGEPSPFSAVYVATADDIRSHGAGLHVASLRETGSDDRLVPITICMQDPQVKVASLNLALSGIRELEVLDLFESCMQPGEAYPGEWMDQRARQVHDCYKQELEPGEPFCPAAPDAMDTWATDHGHAYRWSDRMAAEHVDVKLQLIAVMGQRDPTLGLSPDWYCALCGGDVEKTPAALARLEEVLRREDVIKRLARVEHRRFVAERLVDDWLCLPAHHKGAGPSQLSPALQKLRLRVNHTLVPFDQLAVVDRDVQQREVDVRMIKAIPKLLSEVGRAQTKLQASG